MKYFFFFNIILTSLTGLIFHNNSTNQNTQVVKKSNEIHFFTSDSIKIIGDLYLNSKKATTILLFHQGGSNTRGEYHTIIPKLTAIGFNVLAIDQRVGGQIHGNYNRTVAEIPINNYGYCDAYPDLEAALNYVIDSNFTGKKILWGSSYSASLAIQLANNRTDDIDAVLAFSPASGEQLKDCLPNQYFETLKTPMLLLRPKNEAEFESVKEQLKTAELYNHQTYVAQNGKHGSSMLVEERVGDNVDENWNVVETFLKKFKNKP